MNKVTIIGYNYEGAHFRGIPSDTDQTVLSITISSDSEADLCDWILDNFSYGACDECKTLERLIEGYEDLAISNHDGCGGVYEIAIDGNKRFDDSEEEWSWQDEVGDEGILLLEDVVLNDNTPSLNEMVCNQKG